jgi:hypothetical protein
MNLADHDYKVVSLTTKQLHTLASMVDDQLEQRKIASNQVGMLYYFLNEFKEETIKRMDHAYKTTEIKDENAAALMPLTLLSE